MMLHQLARVKSISICCAFIAIISGSVSASPATLLEQKPITISGVSLIVEIADEAHERSRGLQFRSTLPAESGMLFVYPKEQYVGFWMKDCSVPLDIAFITQEGIIAKIVEGIPFDETLMPSPVKVQYVLEVNKGFFEQHGITEGTRVEQLCD